MLYETIEKLDTEFKVIIKAYHVIIIGLTKDNLETLFLYNLENVNHELKLLAKKYNSFLATFINTNDFCTCKESIRDNVDGLLSIVHSFSGVKRLAFEFEG